MRTGTLSAQSLVCPQAWLCTWNVVGTECLLNEKLDVWSTLELPSRVSKSSGSGSSSGLWCVDSVGQAPSPCWTVTLLILGNELAGKAFDCLISPPLTQALKFKPVNPGFVCPSQNYRLFTRASPGNCWGPLFSSPLPGAILTLPHHLIPPYQAPSVSAPVSTLTGHFCQCPHFTAIPLVILAQDLSTFCNSKYLTFHLVCLWIFSISSLLFSSRLVFKNFFML